jgi:hypothetical protein
LGVSAWKSAVRRMREVFNGKVHGLLAVSGDERSAGSSMSLGACGVPGRAQVAIQTTRV